MSCYQDQGHWNSHFETEKFPSPLSKKNSRCISSLIITVSAIPALYTLCIPYVVYGTWRGSYGSVADDWNSSMHSPGRDSPTIWLLRMTRDWLTWQCISGNSFNGQIDIGPSKTQYCYTLEIAQLLGACLSNVGTVCTVLRKIMAMTMYINVTNGDYDTFDLMV